VVITSFSSVGSCIANEETIAPICPPHRSARRTNRQNPKFDLVAENLQFVTVYHCLPQQFHICDWVRSDIETDPYIIAATNSTQRTVWRGTDADAIAINVSIDKARGQQTVAGPISGGYANTAK